MKRVRLAAVLGGGVLVACTAAPDRSESKTQAVIANEHESESPAPKRCNSAVADAEAAIELAESARRSAGFVDMGEVESPKAMITAGFLLSPMVPSRWPGSDCSVAFYVFKAEVHADNSVYHYRHPVAARVTVRLDTGAVDVVMLDDGPGAGGMSLYVGMPIAPHRQQWVFDAVATSTVPEAPVELGDYRKWLRAEEFVAAALYVWHREFFDFVVAGNAEIMREAEANTRTADAH